jgi:succinate dehydrogenase cytochrome b subunit
MQKPARPLSPHIQVYRWQWTSVLSICHRASGIALAVGSLVLVYWLAALADGPQAYAGARSVLGSFLGRLVLFGFSAALFFHLANGVRHLFWDAGLGFDLPTAQASARAVIVLTIVLTFAAWAVAYAMRGGAA